MWGCSRWATSGVKNKKDNKKITRDKKVNINSAVVLRDVDGRRRWVWGLVSREVGWVLVVLRAQGLLVWDLIDLKHLQGAAGQPGGGPGEERLLG